MFRTRQSFSIASATFRFWEVVYHSVVRGIRKSDRNALLGLFKSMMQMVIMVVIFYVMLSMMGGRAMAIRGDYFVYLLSGIAVFMIHTKTVAAVSGAEGPSSPMMLHTPMNTLVSICSAAISTLYTELLATGAILLIYHVLISPISIEQPGAAFGMVLLGWYSGIGVGYILLALRHWVPGFVSVAKTIYVRLSLFASGKMVTANSLPYHMLPVFTWNPLFHAIDQGRGFVFINYNPHHSTWVYAFLVSSALIMVGFIGEGFARQKVSVGSFADK